MSARTIEQGFNGPPRLVCAGEDTDCASATVGMGVVRWARPLTAAEAAVDASFTARLGKAWADPGTSGRECTGDVHRERAAWVASLPRGEAAA